MTEKKEKWFETWFDTDYYHLLYKHRNQSEAEAFIKQLFTYMKVDKDDKILDVACGRGRHSVAIHQLGYDVTGIDLSTRNIVYAKQFEKNKLRFIKHDMCIPMREKFDVVLNLFTSIGYFEEDTKNIEAVNCFWNSLNEGGVGVIDFLNVTHVSTCLKKNEIKKVGDLTFNIKRNYDGRHFLKEISFDDKNQHFCFKEKVRGLQLKNFENIFNEVGISKYEVFGNYQLDIYHPTTSERLILIFYK